MQLRRQMEPPPPAAAHGCILETSVPSWYLCPLGYSLAKPARMTGRKEGKHLHLLTKQAASTE